MNDCAWINVMAYPAPYTLHVVVDNWLFWNFGTAATPMPRHPRHHKVLNCVLYQMNDGVDFGHSLAASDLLIEVEAGGHTV